MRTIISGLFLAFACSIFLSPSPAFAQEDEPVAAPKAKDVEIAILGESIVVQGKHLTVPFDLGELNKLLGPGDRVTKLFNHITTWDDLGVIAYCKPDTTKVTSVGVCLAKKEFKFSPSKVFVGKLSVDGADITAASLVSQVNAAKKGIKLAVEIPGLPASIKYPSILVTVGETVVDRKPTGMDQVAISWREPKKPEVAPSSP